VPLYAQQGLSNSLAQIDVDAPQTRTGYFLEQSLIGGLEVDPSTQKLYKLTIKMTEDHYNIGYRVDDTSTRSEITNNVTYQLTDIKSGSVLYKDHFTNTVTYASSASPFTGIVSQQNGQERMASSIAQKIQTRLALYFHEKH